MSFWNRFTRRPPVAPVATPAPIVPQPVAVAPRPEIPRYPPFLQGLPVVTPTELLNTQEELIHNLRYGIGCTPEFFADLVLPVVERYAAFVHLLPASETHHHRGAGGLLHHGLEVGFLAGRAAGGKVFAMDRPPSQRRIHEPLWRLAAALGGVGHDLGKPISDVAVTNHDGTLTWSPLQETIVDWAARHGLDSYYLHWRERRHNRHENAGMLVADRILGDRLIARLAETDYEILNALIDAITGTNPTATLTALVLEADRASVERDLKSNRIDPQAHSLGVPIERYLLDAMARLVGSGAWTFNTPGARLWMLDDGLHVVWPQGGEDIVNVLASDHVPGIPRHPDTLADLLIERGYAVAPTGGDGISRYWRLAPAPLARDGKAPVALTLLRLASPHHVLSGPPPAPVPLAGAQRVRSTPVATAATGPREARSQPILRPADPVAAAVPPPGAADRGVDADAWDLGDSIDRACFDLDQDLDQEPARPSALPPSPRDPVPAARPTATPVPPPAAARPSPPTVAARPGPAAAPAAPPPRPASVVDRDPLPAARPAPPPVTAPAPDLQSVARAWFASRRPGAGAQLLLALADVLAAGTQAPDTLIMVPDPDQHVWLRLPEVLPVLGRDQAALDQALWEDNLLEVDFARPLLHARRAADGRLGFVLHVEPSRHFAALLPAGLLDACRERTAPTESVPAVPAPPARPEPPPEPDPAGAPRPSDVVRALLQDLRRTHAAALAAHPEAPVVVTLTRDDLTALATRTGLPYSTLTRTLVYQGAQPQGTALTITLRASA